jgi:hypothetical protein
MKLKITLLLFVALLPLLSFGQGCITVFSEDGDKFYLVLNGQKQNNTPQTNVRIDGLPNEFYSAKILFEDATKPEISKNIPTKDAGTGQFAEVTYKIKKTKDGDLKLRYFGATPVPVNYNPPPDMYVMHYGQAAPAPAPVSTTVTQTTVTSTQVDPNMSMSVNAPGVNINVNMPNVDMNATTTQTTVTRTTTTSSSSSSYEQPQAQQIAVAEGCRYPMDASSFKSAKETVTKASFDETKLSTAKSILSSNCVSTDQVMALCKLFSFESSKLDFAKFAYGKTTDKGNYFKVGNVFDFDASKTDLNDFISNGGR